jgi:hypothetical protein
MSRTYQSFMIRCWRVGASERRIVIEHVQTGEQAHLLTLSAALDWLTERAERQPPRPPPPPTPNSPGTAQ